MKTRNQPTQVHSGDAMEQAILKGLNKKQKQWTKDAIKQFDGMGEKIPYGFIRKTALDLK